jgi:hypothetical protein
MLLRLSLGDGDGTTSHTYDHRIQLHKSYNPLDMYAYHSVNHSIGKFILDSFDSEEGDSFDSEEGDSFCSP